MKFDPRLQLTIKIAMRGSQIKSRLLCVLQQTKAIRKQMCHIVRSHQAFQAELQGISQLGMHLTRNSGTTQADKQNNPHGSNVPSKTLGTKFVSQINSTDREIKLRAVRIEQLQVQKIPYLDDKDNIEMRRIRNNLVTQLKEIKSIEKKEESIRRTNQRMKQYNSKQKRAYDCSISKEKDKKDFTPADLNSLCAASCMKLSELGDSSVAFSDISVELPVSVQTKQATLTCSKGHEYYEGSVNSENEPHGSGRLQICCAANPCLVSNNPLEFKNVQFYQGGFRLGKFEGFGTLSYRGGVKYVGEFRRGKRQGKGSLYYNGKSQVARWENDSFVSVM